jgi:hypothetical protein
MLTGVPLQGIQPAKRDDPPLRPDVPCETQEVPNLDSTPSAPPPMIRVNQSSPAARRLEARGREAASTWLRRRLEADGLDRALKVVTEPLKLADLPALRRTFGGGR